MDKKKLNVGRESGVWHVHDWVILSPKWYVIMREIMYLERLIEIGPTKTIQIKFLNLY